MSNEKFVALAQDGLAYDVFMVTILNVQSFLGFCMALLKLNSSSLHFIFLYIIVLGFSCFAWSDESMDNCYSQQSYIKANINDGILIRNKVSDSVPYVRTSFKYEGINIRVPLYIVDVDNNGLYEIIYLVDLGVPKHLLTKVYILEQLQEESAIDLIEKKRKSVHYIKLIDSLKNKYKWNALRDLVNFNPLVFPLENFFPGQASYEKDFRVTLSQIESKSTFIIENLLLKEITSVSILDLNRLHFSDSCNFKY